MNNDPEIKVNIGAISIIEFVVIVYSTRYNERITKINIESSINNYDKVLNLAIDREEHINLGLHIIQNQMYLIANGIYHQDHLTNTHTPHHNQLLSLQVFISLPIQVLGGGSRKIITLSHRSQVKRFTSDLLRILKSQACKQIGVLELPVIYSELTKAGGCDGGDVEWGVGGEGGGSRGQGESNLNS